MKFDENELIAYHFHELAPQRASEVERMLATDAEASAEFAVLEEMLEAFRDYESVPLVNAAVVERNWQAVRASLPYMGARPVKVGWARKFRWHPLGVGLAGLGAAALVVLGVMMIFPSRRVASPVVDGSEHAAAVAPSASPSTGMGGLPVVGELLGHKVVAERINGRPGPLTTAPVVSDDGDVKDAMLVSPVNPLPESVMDQSNSEAGNLSVWNIEARPVVAMPIHGVLPSSAGKNSHLKRTRWQPQTSISIGGLGQFTPMQGSDASNGTVQTLSSPGVLTSFEQGLGPWAGYKVNFAYTRTIEEYRTQSTTGSSGTVNTVDVKSNIYELTTGYLAHRTVRRRVRAFASVGGGVLIFAPLSNSTLVPGMADTAATTIVRAAGLVDAGAEYALGKHLALRAEYRALVYKGPQFGVASPDIPFYYTFTGEPTLSVVYHFGAQDKD